MMHWKEQSFIACLASFKQVIYGLINYKREDAPIWVVVRSSRLLFASFCQRDAVKVMEKFIHWVNISSVCQFATHNAFMPTLLQKPSSKLHVSSEPLIIITDKKSISDRQVLLAGWLPYPKRRHIIEALWGNANILNSRQIINLTYTLIPDCVCTERQSCQKLYSEMEHIGVWYKRKGEAKVMRNMGNRLEAEWAIKKWSIMANYSSNDASPSRAQ